jgi:hypothetical protein
VSLLAKLTNAPGAGAGPLSVTVPVELLPPTTELGDLVTEDKTAGLTVMVVVRLTPAYEAVMVTDIWLATGLVVIVKVALCVPPGIVTLAGTCAAAALLLSSVTEAPAGGAIPFSVTVPIELLPPTTEVGDRLREDKTAALTVRVALALTPRVAFMTEVVVVGTPSVVTAKVVDALPAGTVTLVGTVAAAVLLLVSVTTAPPAGAAALN